MMYKVKFEFRLLDTEISDGRWHEAEMNNNGQGYTFDEAESIACDLRSDVICDNRNVEVEEMEV